MAQKYRYNPETLKYEPWYLRGRTLRLRMAFFTAVAFVMALIGYGAYVKAVGSFDEMVLKQRNEKLRISWQLLEDRMNRANQQLQQLAERDDNNYRVILDIDPLQANIRKAGVGGSEKFDRSPLQDFPHILRTYDSLLSLQHQVGIELQSFTELTKLTDDKLEAWASKPAIQPISNKQLDKLHMTYGARLHPIFHRVMDHKGLDFAASTGTPVYSTGDGKVAMAYFSGSYGNVIYIDHGHDYETRYAHLSRFAIKPGAEVKRGQVIGYVGNTGNSKAPHLHYEVLYKGQHVNPINFFQRDLSNKEYEKLIEIGSQQDHPLD